MEWCYPREKNQSAFQLGSIYNDQKPVWSRSIRQFPTEKSYGEVFIFALWREAVDAW